jgi:hypothetical protein
VKNTTFDPVYTLPHVFAMYCYGGVFVGIVARIEPQEVARRRHMYPKFRHARSYEIASVPLQPRCHGIVWYVALPVCRSRNGFLIMVSISGGHHLVTNVVISGSPCIVIVNVHLSPTSSGVPFPVGPSTHVDTVVINIVARCM